MILFIIINTFDLPAIELPFMTIPRMVQNRYETVTTLFSGNIIVNSLKNFINSVIILITQNDGLPWNAIEGYGIIYLFSLPFTVIGIISEFKNKEKYSYVLKAWSLSSFLMLFICNPNINRCNILMIPIIYYTIMGICEVIKEVKCVKVIILLLYITSFIGFRVTYFNTEWNEYYTFASGIEEVVEHVESLEYVEKIYFPYNIKEPYIYVLFYSKTNPQIYVDTVQKKNEKGTFENIKSFGKYEFYEGKIDIAEDYKNIYIIPNKAQVKFDEEKYDVMKFEKYLVIRLKESAKK